MRVSIASIFFVVVSFIFFVIWAVCTFFLDTVNDALVDNIALLSASSQASATATFDLIVTGFGIIAVFFFISAILLHYVADSWRDDPEYYYR